VRPGDLSPLQEYASIPPARGAGDPLLVADLGHRYGIEVLAWYHGGADRWEIDWELLPDGTPTTDQVRETPVLRPRSLPSQALHRDDTEQVCLA
jgi:hypothetical protein